VTDGWKESTMSDPYVSDPYRHTHEVEPVREPETGSGLVGFAAIKYTAIVVIVLAILAFLAWYVLPRL
jgi:hypothetical protein